MTPWEMKASGILVRAYFIPPGLIRKCVFLLVIAASIVHSALADSDYYRHVIFDNSMNTGSYWYSTGRAIAPSALEQKDGHLPVEEGYFLSAPNALRISWQSKPDGGWDAEIHIVNFRYRFPEFKGKNLYFWCYSQDGIAAKDL